MKPAVTASADGVEALRVELGERGYDILVGADVISRAGRLMKPVLPRPRIVVVTDATVAKLHLNALTASLDEAGIAHGTIVLPAGEATKDFLHLERLIEELLAQRVERSTMLVALGGGVIGDIAGFAASIVLRGLDFVQIPTTLLAQVDSAVGGKTAINTKRGKNLVGAFHQPRLVLADTGALSTLPKRELLAGYAEVVKYGLIDDAPFFAWLEENGPALIAGDTALRRQAVAASCAAKARIVALDERETGPRALLNLGHTFGHALEAEAGYGGAVLHGEAVAAGMVMAFDLSVRLGLCPAEDAARARRHLRAVGLPTGADILGPAGRNTDRLIDHMRQDKKVKDGRVTFILARGIGKSFIAHDVELDEVRRMLDAAAAA